MQAFIIRPFGVKNNVDFDRVDRELIQPALKIAGITGSTTAAIVEQGNIRTDMFAELLLADLVIADLSIHNANVFYELGVRHALRDKKTFLIRSSIDEIPFDLKTDRYLIYEVDNPAQTLLDLVNGLKATMLSEKADSPVFYMLPKLQAQDPERFLAVPKDFSEEVEVARACKQPGKLALLASEVEGFSWRIPALRLIGEHEFCLKAFEGARLTWEKVLDDRPFDLEANNRLSTIYQRLAEVGLQNNASNSLELLAQSDLAVKRLLENYPHIERSKRGEVYSLKARNSKSKWINAWKLCKDEACKENALQSPYLLSAFNDYYRAYEEDLNNYYAGINALGLLTVLITLAEALPNIWSLEFDTELEATSNLLKYKDQQKKLAAVVQSAVEAEKKRMQREERTDPWVNITEADLGCLTSPRPERVAALYEKAIKEANDLNLEAGKRQLEMYGLLQIMPNNVAAALKEFESVNNEAPKNTHYLLFAGHMIDRNDRDTPRFPADAEDVAKAAIKKAIQNEIDGCDEIFSGIAGGACGADILFHESCVELGIASEMYLALPRDQFIAESVSFAGPDWIERFEKLYKVLPHKQLAKSQQLPDWLQKKADYNIWTRNNLWMLNTALVAGGAQMTIIVLWDGKGGDGLGGTEHMVKEAEKRGAKTVILNTNKLFSLNTTSTL